MKQNQYALKNPEEIISPAFIYYRDIILHNTRKALEVAGGPDRLWPHVKTHKTEALIKMQLELGITRFKCATIAEAQMLADAGAKHVLLAYPLVGPNIKRYLALCRLYPGVHFYAIGDDYAQIAALAQGAIEAAVCVDVLLDINMGMDRTGVVYDEAVALYEACAALEGIAMIGLHCYDGHYSMGDETTRYGLVEQADVRIADIQRTLVEKGLHCGIIVVGGTPSFPCHAQYGDDWYLSPGTIFVHDLSYADTLHDIDAVPGAAVLTRVVSHPNAGLFTLDLGSKGISTDPPGVRGAIVGMEHAKPLRQSEEHWVFKMDEGYEGERPPIGTVLYVLPTHICPTSALYPTLLVAEGGELVDEWPVTARNRKITV